MARVYTTHGLLFGVSMPKERELGLPSLAMLIGVQGWVHSLGYTMY